jgi:acyl dehydratase
VKVGDAAAITRTFETEDLLEYVTLSGHETTGAQVPEPLIGALFSYLLGVELPGTGTMYLKQHTDYRAVARAGETLTARVEITRLRPDKQLADLSTSCVGGDGRIIANGRALVYIGHVSQEAHRHG